MQVLVSEGLYVCFYHCVMPARNLGFLTAAS